MTSRQPARRAWTLAAVAMQAAAQERTVDRGFECLLEPWQVIEVRAPVEGIIASIPVQGLSHGDAGVMATGVAAGQRATPERWSAPRDLGFEVPRPGFAWGVEAAAPPQVAIDWGLRPAAVPADDGHRQAAAPDTAGW